MFGSGTCRRRRRQRKARFTTCDTVTGRSPDPPPLEVCQFLACRPLEPSRKGPINSTDVPTSLSSTLARERKIHSNTLLEPRAKVINDHRASRREREGRRPSGSVGLPVNLSRSAILRGLPSSGQTASFVRSLISYEIF